MRAGGFEGVPVHLGDTQRGPGFPLAIREWESVR